MVSAGWKAGRLRWRWSEVGAISWTGVPDENESSAKLAKLADARNEASKATNEYPERVLGRGRERRRRSVRERRCQQQRARENVNFLGWMMRRGGRGLVDTLGRKRGAVSTPAPPSPPKTITPPLWRGWNHQRRPEVGPRPFSSSSLSFLFLSFFLYLEARARLPHPSPPWTRILRFLAFVSRFRRGWDRGRAKMRVGTGLLKFRS